MANIKCSSCGAEIDENNAFCSSCGASQKKAEATEVKVEQPAQQTSGQPFVYFDVAKTVEANKQNQPAPNTKKKGVLIGAIICFVIGILLSALYAYHYTGIITASEENVLVFLLFLLYVFTLGWLTVIPAGVLMIVNIVLTSIGLKSSSKAVKVWSGIFLGLSIAVLVAIVLSILIPSIFNIHV